MEQINISARQIWILVASILGLALASSLAFRDIGPIVNVIVVLSAFALLAVTATLINLIFLAPLLKVLGRMTSKAGFWQNGQQQHLKSIAAEFKTKQAELNGRMENCTDPQTRLLLTQQLTELEHDYNEKVRAAGRSLYAKS